MNYFLPILAVFLGYVFILLLKPKDKRYLKLILAFSGAFLLSVIVFHMLPEIYEHEGKQIGIFIIVGILLQIVLEYFSKGAEHGHIHISKNNTNFPWVLFISLSIHSFLEGFPLDHHHHLVYGIVIHKFPIAVFLSTFFIESKFKKGTVVSFLLLFALMTPLGTLAQEHLAFIKPYIHDITAVVVGILLHISTTILFESSENHKYNTGKLLVILGGFITAYFI